MAAGEAALGRGCSSSSPELLMRAARGAYLSQAWLGVEKRILALGLLFSPSADAARVLSLP